MRVDEVTMREGSFSSSSNYESALSPSSDNLDSESKINIESLKKDSWIRSSLIYDKKFFDIVKCDSNMRTTFKCLLCFQFTDKLLIVYTSSGSNLWNHVKVREGP